MKKTKALSNHVTQRRWVCQQHEGELGGDKVNHISRVQMIGNVDQEDDKF